VLGENVHLRVKKLAKRCTMYPKKTGVAAGAARMVGRWVMMDR
jgi:hypothetical protein